MPNQQVTTSEFAGMETFFSYRDDTIPILELGISQSRFHDAIFGRSAIKKNVIYGEMVRPPDHFGYGKYASFSDLFESPRYLLLTNLGRNLFLRIYPEFQDAWRFTPEDFDRLNIDRGVHKIYTNGNLDIYFIESRSSENM